MDININAFFAILCSLTAILFILTCRKTYIAINRHNQSRSRGLVHREKLRQRAEFEALVEQNRTPNRRVS